MPELPDITVYVEAIAHRAVGERLVRVSLPSPFVLRSTQPGIDELPGLSLLSVTRLGKRIVLGFEDEISLVIHLMIAGRLHWRAAEGGTSVRRPLAVLEFPSGSLLLTEAGTRKRASIHVVRGADELARHDPGGLEMLDASESEFAAAITRRAHTLKRALTDPHIVSGIGNAYSDEILHRARMSPVKLTTRLTTTEIERLLRATKEVLSEWTERLRVMAGDGFPEKVTAFREGMSVHGRYRQPCPDCGTAVQRIVQGHSEANYCPLCQTDGKLLADRALSRLLHRDWPRTIEELEERLTASDLLSADPDHRSESHEEIRPVRRVAGKPGSASRMGRGDRRHRSR